MQSYDITRSLDASYFLELVHFFHFVLDNNVGTFLKSFGLWFILLFAGITSYVAVILGFVTVMRLLARVPVGAVIFKVVTTMTMISLLFTFVSNCLPDGEDYIKGVLSS